MAWLACVGLTIVLACDGPASAPSQPTTRSSAQPPASQATPPSQATPSVGTPASQGTQAVQPSAATPEPKPATAPETQPKPALIDIRGDEVIPPGTAPSHAAAFRKLAIQKGDKAPVGGIGSGGIHLDELTTGHGWHASRCDDESREFTIGVQDRVNVCMRVVHERGTRAELSVEWLKKGKQARRSKVSIGDMHALLTRSYLPISAGYEGEWTALIKSVDGTVIGEVSFTVK